MTTKDTPDAKTSITASITDQSNYGTWPSSELGPLETSPPSELSILVASSSPLVIGTILQFSQVAIALLFVGRLGKDELAATSLACLTANVTGWSVIQGLSSALDTLCPQAFGAGLKKVVGLHVQRMAGLLICVSVVVGCFWYVRISPSLIASEFHERRENIKVKVWVHDGNVQISNLAGRLEAEDNKLASSGC